MTKKLLMGSALSVLLLLGMVASAERADHFKGLPAETLEAAVKNFSEYNKKLEAVLDKGTLTAADLATIHELTYTLENALEKINEDFTALAETLEAVHVASESADSATVMTRGREYLSVSRQVID